MLFSYVRTDLIKGINLPGSFFKEINYNKYIEISLLRMPNNYFPAYFYGIN